MKLLISDGAERDLDTSGGSIGAGRSRQAAAFFDHLYARILLIATVEADRVVIVRVLNGVRDSGRLLSSASDEG